MQQPSPKPRVFWILTGVLTAVPFAILAGFVHRYGVNVPFSDQWEMALMLMQSRDRGVGLGDLFAQHGEQRMLFPRLIMLAMASLTDWNIRAELLLNLLLAAVIFVLLMLILVKTHKTLGVWTLLPAGVLSLMVFSPVQWEDWFWGWQISWFLPLLSFVLAAATLWFWPDDRPAAPAIAVAVVAALIGQYSLLSASLIWVACLPLFLVKPGFRKYWWIWAGVGAASTLVYLKDYVSPPSMREFHMPPSLLLEDPKRPLAYLLYLLGRPVLDAEPSYAIGGLFLLAFFLVSAYFLISKRDRLPAASIWLVVGGYALALGMLTTAGRLGIGLTFAGSSRYTTIGVLFMAATAALISLALLPDASPRDPSRQDSPQPAEAARSRLNGARHLAAVAIWLALGGLFLADYDSEVDTLKLWHMQRVQIKQCLLQAESPQDPCLRAAYPATEAVYERTQFLKSIGWGGLREEPDRNTG